MKIINVDQNSPEWHQLRLGKITASIMSKVVTRTGKPSASVDDVINRAVAELILQEPDESYISDAMLRGRDLEDQALKFFNFTNDYSFVKTGFLDSELGYGCSPDGIDLVNEVGLELKCPMPHTHISYLADEQLPDQYWQQVQGSLMVSGFKTWIFGSYHPRLPCFKVLVERDEKYISILREETEKACEKIKQKHLKLLVKITG